MSHLSSVPSGMSRRHFIKHLAGASLMVGPAMSFFTSFCDFPQKEHCKLP